MTTGCYPVPGPLHAARHAHHAGHVHAATPHGAVHHAPVHHLPVYGPPPPSVALNCVRTPGALPAGPGAAPASHAAVEGAQPATQLAQSGVQPGIQPGIGDFSRAAYGQGPAAAVTPSIGSGALGLAQAALVAGGLSLAAAGGVAMLAPVSTGPVQPVGPIYAAIPPINTLPGPIQAPTAPGPITPGPITPGPITPGPIAAGPIINGVSPPGDQPSPAPLVTPPLQTATPATPIPEPATLLLFAVGAVAARAARLYRRRPPSPSGAGAALP